MIYTNRVKYLEKFNSLLQAKKELFAQTISQDTGKPLWESNMEVGGMLNKLKISIAAHNDRCGLPCKPIGKLAIIGPFNFPGHLPHGHIVPALLAGNSVVFKPSEHTPRVADLINDLWQQVKLPTGVFSMVQGGPEVVSELIKRDDINGILFTGSYKVGRLLHQQLAGKPEKLLVLEMGGNNPLVINKISEFNTAIDLVIKSAYITAGQRCTCARRLIVVKSRNNEKLIDKLILAINKIKIGHYTDIPEPFMGPVINENAANNILKQYQGLITLGAKTLIPIKKITSSLLSPGLIDVTGLQVPDEEIFGPLLQLIWVDDFDAAIIAANNTAYGLAAGLLSTDKEDYNKFYSQIRAGIINWNQPLTGAKSNAPFGGVGRSGNYRPSAYYAADYCSYPVASMLDDTWK